MGLEEFKEILEAKTGGILKSIESTNDIMNLNYNNLSEKINQLICHQKEANHRVSKLEEKNSTEIIPAIEKLRPFLKNPVKFMFIYSAVIFLIALVIAGIIRIDEIIKFILS